MQQPRQERVYRVDNGVWLIEIKLREARQLFDSLDPAPFLERDLDADAEAYIVGAVREIGHGRPIRIVVYLPPDELATEYAKTLPEAVRNYFHHAGRVAGAGLRQMLGIGGFSLLIGLAFLFTCLWLRELVGMLVSGTARAILEEGLLIMGWVAMWRPIQLFLYDWWPIRRRQRLCEQIAATAIEVLERPSVVSVPDQGKR